MTLTEKDCFEGLKRLNLLSEEGEERLKKLEGDQQ